MSLGVSISQLLKNQINQLRYMPYPRPYYDHGGQVIYYDGFEDGILRWSQRDDYSGGLNTGTNTVSTTGAGFVGSAGAQPVGLGGTFITGRMSHSGTKSLCLRMPPFGNTFGTGFQDACLGLSLIDANTPVFPILGLEARILAMEGNTGFFGMSIERISGTNKLEWRVEYVWGNSQTRKWRHVYGTGGASNEFILTNYIGSPVTGDGGSPSGGVPSRSMWTPVKLIADLSNINAGGLLLHDGPYVSSATANGVNNGNENFATPESADMVTFEFHWGSTGDNNQNDIFIDDVFITLENAVI